MPNAAAVTKDRPVVLVVDDETPNLRTFARVFRRDYRVEIASEVAEARKLLASIQFDVALVDYKMPEVTGVEFLMEARAIQPNMGRIIVTAYADLPDVREALLTGLSAAIIMKPWKREEIVKWVTHFARVKGMRTAVNEMREATRKSKE